MLDIKVLGTNCAKCNALERITKMALEILEKEAPDLEATIEHVTDVLAIQRYPVLFTPALVVNEKVVCAGRVPKKEEVLAWLRTALNAQA